MSRTPIAELALLSDRHSAALVDSAGCVQWLCFPRFDGPSVFGRLLDDEAGHWRLAPLAAAGAATATRRYLDGSLILETTWQTGTGRLVLTDALALGPATDPHALGQDAPRLLIRRLHCAEGTVDVELSYAPRPEYGLVHPLLSATEGGVTARGGAEWLVLTAPGDLRLDASTATGAIRLGAGDTVHLALHRSTLAEPPARVWSQRDLAATLDQTLAAWQSWSKAHQTYDGPWADLVHQSGRVLLGLSYQPSGAIVAAATTSLPEAVGGERNWDYRYAWVRDASLTMEALWVAACPDEADKFFMFLATAAAGTPVREQGLQIMFGVGGEHDLTERSLPHLTGWRDSRPVRLGNEAWDQRQLDVYGELLGSVARLVDQLDGLDAQTRTFLVSCADTAARVWREPDQGIWEVRGEARHFLHSRLMCWVALDRAIGLADLLGAQDRIPDWTLACEQVRDAVLADGWNDEAGAFTQYVGTTSLDASTLVMPLVGLLPADDPRMLATIDAIAERLTDERGLLYRYRTGDGVDGLAGEEGTFLICTFWLAEALARSGQVDRARDVFERAAAYVNDVGLLAEEIDTHTGEPLGNFPQALSHIGLVNAAWAISEVESTPARPAESDVSTTRRAGSR